MSPEEFAEHRALFHDGVDVLRASSEARGLRCSVIGARNARRVYDSGPALVSWIDPIDPTQSAWVTIRQTWGMGETASACRSHWSWLPVAQLWIEARSQRVAL